MLKIHPTRTSLKLNLAGSKPALEAYVAIFGRLAEIAGPSGAPVQGLARLLQSAADGNHRMFMSPSQPGGCWYEMDIATAELERALPVIREFMFSGLLKGMQSVHALTFSIHAAQAVEAARTPMLERMSRAAIA